ncbi:DNA ligase [Paenibacillus sp. LHD-117]|uniref:ATP-dependent DNA ligase n=1 Tax=Paenibacillus sp. LHD-117 TaxID=3071412 RepID=UPI0027E0BF17|nr:DNA ligase [Paenibacillus sp. LHD-117]MDQ6419316.1 DNA ligase [Paenibacillus sp. LHD-117]
MTSDAATQLTRSGVTRETGSPGPESMALPKVPMSPIASPQIPEGPEWVYQIKWDGVRTIARLDGNGGVELFSKKMELRNGAFPEIVELLKPLGVGPCVLDGEIVYFDGKRPNFQRGKLAVGTHSAKDNLLLVLFDLLHDDGGDWRGRPFLKRFERLTAKFPDKQPKLFVTELYADGNALWDWVNEKEWEGVVSKRADSPYTEGKRHQDWFKKRKEIRLVADVVGLKRNNGQVASLVLSLSGTYIGHVSGLDQASKSLLDRFAKDNTGICPFAELTPGMRKSDVAWLSVPFPCRVAALEFTDSGLLRQPRLLGFGADAAAE